MRICKILKCVIESLFEQLKYFTKNYTFKYIYVLKKISYKYRITSAESKTAKSNKNIALNVP